MSTFSGDETAPFFGFLGAAAALVFSCMGAAYGTAKSGVGVASMGVMRPELVMKSIVPVVMAGVLGIYGLIIAVIISTGINPKAKSYYLFDGYAHLSSGLACGLAGLSAGMAIGIVGDAGVSSGSVRSHRGDHLVLPSWSVQSRMRKRMILSSWIRRDSFFWFLPPVSLFIEPGSFFMLFFIRLVEAQCGFATCRQKPHLIKLLFVFSLLLRVDKMMRFKPTIVSNANNKTTLHVCILYRRAQKKHVSSEIQKP
ncbi:hypothetical protein YC2023_096189 [Brassica napus]